MREISSVPMSRHSRRLGAVRAGTLLGIGAATATGVLGLAYGVVDRPLPYHEPAQLILLVQEVMTSGPTVRLEHATPDELEFWRGASDVFQGAGGYVPSTLLQPGENRLEAPIRVGRFTDDLPSVLGVAPLRGRDFSQVTAHEREGAVVISEPYWRSRFGSDEAALGARINVGGTEKSVIGIMPSQFRFPLEADVWLPADTTSGAAIARLQPGLTVELAVDTIKQRGRLITTDTKRTWTAQTLQSMREGRVPARVRGTVYAVALLVVVLTIVGAAGMGFHGASRYLDRLAVMIALGAQQRDLIRVVVGQGLGPLYVAIPVAAGVGVLLSDGLDAWVPADIRWFLFISSSPSSDLSLPIAAVVGAVLCWLASAAVPVGVTWHLGTGDGGGVLAARRFEGRRRVQALASIMRTAQLVLATVLVSAAVVLIAHHRRLTATDWGYNPAGLSHIAISLPSQTFPEREERRHALSALINDLQRSGRFSAVAAGDPPTGRLTARLMKDGVTLGSVRTAVFGRDFFEVSGVRLLVGDRPTNPVTGAACPVVVTAEVASNWLGDSPPAAIGSRVSLSGWADEMVVVGVASPIRRPESRHGVPVVLIPDSCDSLRTASLLFRGANSEDPSFQATTRDAVRAAGFRSVTFGSTEQEISRGLIVPTFYARAVMFVAVIVLGITLMSIYAVTVDKLVQIRHVVWMWRVLGAPWTAVLKEAVRRESAVIVIGVATGLASVCLLERRIGPGPDEVSIAEPVLFVAAAAVMVLVSVGSSFVAYYRQWSRELRW